VATINQANDIATIPGCVTVLAEAFGKTVSVGMFRAYELGLRGLTGEQIKAATQQALETCRFMPPPAELRELVYLRPQDRAVKAWLAFERAVVANGYIRTVCSTIRLSTRRCELWAAGSIAAQCPPMSLTRSCKSGFRKRIARWSRAGVSQEQAAPLIGWFDRENALNGYGAQPVQCIETGLPFGAANADHAKAKAAREASGLAEIGAQEAVNPHSSPEERTCQRL
jgi:hypothetical protein